MSERASGVSGLQQNNYSVFSIFAMIYCTACAGAFGVEEIVSGCGPGMTISILIGMGMSCGTGYCRTGIYYAGRRRLLLLD